MSEKPEITKQELLGKVLLAFSGVVARLPQEASVEIVAVATARALGWRVTEAPALPERLRLEDGAFVDAVTGDVPVGEGWERLRPELVRRYNAKDAVLAIADSIEAHLHGGPRWTFGEIPRRLRAAYEAPAP